MFRRGTLLCFRKFRASKKFMPERENHEFLWGICCIPVPENFVEERFSVSGGFGHRKRLCLKGNITNVQENLLFPNAGMFRRGTLLCFRKFRASKKFMPERENHEFLWGICCIPVPENFVEERFCVSGSFGHRKILCLTGNNTICYREIVVSHYRKFSSRYPSVIQKVSGIENFYA